MMFFVLSLWRRLVGSCVGLLWTMGGVVLVAGCASGPAKQVKPLPIVKPPSSSVTEAWRVSVGSLGDANVIPLRLKDESVIVALPSGDVLRIVDGRVTQRVKLEKPLVAGVGGNEQGIFVATQEGEIIALTADSFDIRWRVKIPAEVIAVPVVTGKTVVIRTADSQLFGLNDQTGKRLWLYRSVALPLVLRNRAAVAVQDGVLISGMPGGNVVVINPQDGSLIWEGNLAKVRGTTEIERISDIGGLPVSDGKLLCAAAYRSKVGCFDIRRASLAWTQPLLSWQGLAMDAQSVYAALDNGHVVALNPTKNGETLWRQDQLAGSTLTAPVVSLVGLIVGDSSGGISILSRTSGELVTRFEVDGQPIGLAPIVDREGMLVLTRAGTLVRYVWGVTF